MTKSILAAALALIFLAGPATLNADAKHWKGGRFGNNGNFGRCGYPGNSYFGHNHKRWNRGRCGGYGGGGGWYNAYNGRGTVVDRLVGNGYGGGYRRYF